MSDLREDVRLFTATPSDDVGAVYDRVASRYDRFREQWLAAAGASAELAMLADVTDALKPGVRVLDAGCGTGALSREMLALCPAIDLTMLDISPRMLARTADLPGEHLLGSVLDLPFPDDHFDVVVSAWVIETIPDPMRAVTELLRVLAPTGRLIYTFCSLPDGWFSRAGSALLRAGVKRGFAGDFLPEDRTPWHDCGRSHRQRFHSGLTTEIALAKCCTVGPGALPADRRPKTASAPAAQVTSAPSASAHPGSPVAVSRPGSGVPPRTWQRLGRRYDCQLWLERSAVRAALDLADPQPGDRLLDLGTGTGEVLRLLASRPARPRFAVGVDTSSAMLSRVPVLPLGWTVREGDALALPFPAGEFTVAVASYVLHVLPEALLQQALSELARVLRPGGRLITITPVLPDRGALRPLAAAFDAAAQRAPALLGGLRAFDPTRALEQAGFTLLRGQALQRGYPSLCILAQKPMLTTRAAPRI